MESDSLPGIDGVLLPRWSCWNVLQLLVWRQRHRIPLDYGVSARAYEYKKWIPYQRVVVVIPCCALSGMGEIIMVLFVLAAGTAAAVCKCIEAGAEIVRVHDTAEISAVRHVADALWPSSTAGLPLPSMTG